MPTYPRKRPIYVKGSIVLLQRIRNEIPHLQLPRNAVEIRRTYENEPGMPKWLMWTYDNVLTKPRVGSQQTIGELLTMKQLIAVRSEDNNYIEIQGRKSTTEVNRYFPFRGSISRLNGRSYTVHARRKGGGITAELVGKHLGMRMHITWDKELDNELLIIETLKDGKTIESKIIKED